MPNGNAYDTVYKEGASGSSLLITRKDGTIVLLNGRNYTIAGDYIFVEEGAFADDLEALLRYDFNGEGRYVMPSMQKIFYALNYYGDSIYFVEGFDVVKMDYDGNRTVLYKADVSIEIRIEDSWLYLVKATDGVDWREDIIDRISLDQEMPSITGDAMRMLPLSEYPQWEDAYRTELARFYQAALTDSFEYIYAEGQAVEDFAYAFYDIDHNGIAELIKSQYQNGEEIFEIFTMENGVPVCIASAGDRAGNIYIGVSGLMWNWGSDGANHPVGSYFRIAENGQARESLWSIDIVVDANWDGDEEDTEITVFGGNGGMTAMEREEYIEWLVATLPDEEYRPGGMSARGTVYHEPGEKTINDDLIFKPLSAF